MNPFWRYQCPQKINDFRDLVVPFFWTGLFRSLKVRDISLDQSLLTFLSQYLTLLPCWEAFCVFTETIQIRSIRTDCFNIRHNLGDLSNYLVTLFCPQTGQVVDKKWRFFVDIDILKKGSYTKGKVLILTFLTILYWTAEGIWFPKTGFRKHLAEDHLWFWSRSA